MNMKVFLHGWGMNSAIFVNFIENYFDKKEVLNLDLPGYEPNPSEVKSFDEQVRALKSKIPEGAHLIAWSLGGLYALRFNDLFPNYLSKISMVASTPCFAQKYDFKHALNKELLTQFGLSLSKNREKTIERFLLLQLYGVSGASSYAKSLKQLIAEYSTPSIDVLNQGLEYLSSLDLRGELASTKVPIHFVLGKRDQIVPFQVKQDLLGLSNLIQVDVLQKAGHMPFLTETEEFLRML